MTPEEHTLRNQFHASCDRCNELVKRVHQTRDEDLLTNLQDLISELAIWQRCCSAIIQVTFGDEVVTPKAKAARK